MGTNKLLNASEKEIKKDPKNVHAMPEVMNLTVAELYKFIYKFKDTYDDQSPFKMSSVIEIENSSSSNLSSMKSPQLIAIDSTKYLVGNSMQSANDDTDHSENSLRDLKRISFQSRDTIVDNVVSETSFLNEAENWKGLNKKINPIKSKIPNKANKRGKYLTACPDIEIIHKRSKFITILPLLVNGNFLKPVKIREHIVNVRNTCAFDSTIQSMLAAYDFTSYSEYLTEGNIYLSLFIQTLSTTGVTAKLYKERGCILSTTKEIKDGILDCTINISYLQEKFILRDVPSLSKVLRCTDCLFENSKIILVLHLNPVSIYRHGMAGLQEAVNETYKPKSSSNKFSMQEF